MDSDQIVRTFSDFFEERGHRRITGNTLLTPPGDPVLFTTSGMHPLTPHLEGRPHPLGRRLSGLQRCLRTTDLEEVGDRTHLTVFEMLGSWSLGDYGLPQSLRWGHELLRDGFGIPPERMHVTVFGGDDETGPDDESLDTWRELGLPVETTSGDNWWSHGPAGLCGPDSEIFVWTGGPGTPPHGTPTTDPRWVEVWNHVGMRHHRTEDGTLEPLRQRNVDTGMGLERLVMLLQGRDSVHDTDLFEPWTRALPPLWHLDEREARLVTDHLRSAAVVIGDGVRPSATTRGYVLRRLLRRTLTTLWRVDPSRTLADLPEEPLRHTLDHFRLPTGTEEVRGVLREEERRFRDLVRRGRRVLERREFSGPLSDDDHRRLHDTYGLPRDLVKSLRAG